MIKRHSMSDCLETYCGLKSLAILALDFLVLLMYVKLHQYYEMIGLPEQSHTTTLYKNSKYYILNYMKNQPSISCISIVCYHSSSGLSPVGGIPWKPHYHVPMKQRHEL